MSIVDDIDWSSELVKAISQHAKLLWEASQRVVESGVSDYPVLIAYLDGVDWCPTVLPGYPASNGWSFAITNLDEMVEIGAISENAGIMLKMIGTRERDAFQVFNAETPKVNLRTFKVP